MADIIVAKRLIDYVGLGVKGIPEGYQRLFKDVAVVLALNEAMGPDGAALLNVDANGNLRVTTGSGVTGGGVTIQDDPAVSANKARVVGGVTTSPQPALAVAIGLDGKGGALVEWTAGTAASLITQPVPPTGLVASPGEWSTNNSPGAGTAASAVRAAGGAGVRHVGKRVSFVMSSQAAIALSTVTINIRDGASGAGSILEQFNFDLPAAIVAPFQLLLTGLNIVGSAATAMTAEMAAGIAGLRASVSLAGYDAA